MLYKMGGENKMTEIEMWNKYNKINKTAEKYDAWQFGGNTPEMPDILADLVLKGIKTATSSAYPCYVFEKAPLPPVGGYNLILNTKGEAVCITETIKVYTIPFNQVNEQHAWKEGEFDRTLTSWKKCHSEVFSMELKEIGEEFTENMLVVCEEFKVVYPII
ncbi:ASCH domain-containing protein [Terrisporobacter mayombei]|uniref:ASCH domain-containing protein n=1 Tax=Terrisporobacter mayombei TaxID=1541 RepID=UPI00265A57FA|nr:ASCH domain-containing protein [Terrisporobacter mayombei]